MAADVNLRRFPGRLGEFRAIGPSSRGVGRPYLCARAFAEGRIPACLEDQPLLDAATQPPDAPSATRDGTVPSPTSTRGSLADAAVAASARLPERRAILRTIATCAPSASLRVRRRLRRDGLTALSRNPARARADVVHEHAHRTVVVGDDDVGVAIVIEIAECRATADVFDREGFAAIRDFLEATLATVAKELTALLQTGTARSRRALRPYASPLRSRWRDPADHRCPHRATRRRRR